MYAQLKNRRTFAAKDDAAAGGGSSPAIGPGAETDALAGDEEAFDPGAAAAHHAKMADFHASKAGPEPGDETGELPDFETGDTAIPSPEETATPAEAFGATPVTEPHKGPPPDEEETLDEAAGESQADEAAEPKKKGPSAFNKFRKGGY